MAVSNYEFSALTQSDVGGPIYCGDTFTMTSPGACITATDNDAFLSGDNVRNENANDASYQTATIEGSNGELVKITSNDGAQQTQFGGKSGSYDIKVCA